MINQFVEMKRKVNINFDCKRIWLNDYKNYSEILKRNVYSIPHILNSRLNIY